MGVRNWLSFLAFTFLDEKKKKYFSSGSLMYNSLYPALYPYHPGGTHFTGKQS